MDVGAGNRHIQDHLERPIDNAVAVDNSRSRVGPIRDAVDMSTHQPLGTGLQLGNYAYTYDQIAGTIGTQAIHWSSIIARLDDQQLPSGALAAILEQGYRTTEEKRAAAKRRRAKR